MTTGRNGTAPASPGAVPPVDSILPPCPWDGDAPNIPAVPVLAGDWDARAAELVVLLTQAAFAKALAVRCHAHAWLTGDGSGIQRDQQARLCSAGLTMSAEIARAKVDGYQLLLAAAARAEQS